MMAKTRTRRLVNTLTDQVRRWRNPVLAGTISNLSDEQVDDALARAGLTRLDLFSPGSAIAEHRTRMAHMLVTRDVNVRRLVADNWNELKQADGACSKCTQIGRCHRWLEWGRPNFGPQVFCPNAALFKTIAEEQASRVH